MEGRLIGVGVGPGDPELLTLAAVRAIRESDCILLPNEKKEECYAYKIVRQVVPEIEEKEICPMQFPMTKDADVLRAAQDRCFAEVQARMRQGKTLVFLTIGDPSVYSTYHYIHRRVLAAGMPASMISGVPSFCAVAARLGISLADQGEEIHIIPGSYAVEDTADYDGTRIYMKSGKKLEQLIRHASDRACAEKTAGRIFGGLWRLELRTAGGTCDAWDRCVDTGGKLPYNCDCEGEKTGQITIFSLKFFQ